MLKRCADCKEQRPAGDFGANKRSKDGLKSYCRSCSSARQRAYVAANREKVREADKRYYEANRETIIERETEKYWKNPEAKREAGRKRRIKDGEAIREADRKRYAEDPTRKKKAALENYRRNRTKKLERMRDYWAENNERMLDYQRQYYEDNKPAFIAYAAKRRSAKLQRSGLLTPETEAQIKAIYAEAKRLTEETGIVHHVDHIVPLRGETCSGLHVPCNLRVIPAQLNIAKGAKIDYELVPNAFRIEEFARA